MRCREGYRGRSREQNPMIRREDTGRFCVVTNRKALIKGLVLELSLNLAVPADMATRPQQETPYTVDDSVIEGEVMFFK